MKNTTLFILLIISGFLQSQNFIKSTVIDADGHLIDGMNITLTKEQKPVSTSSADLGCYTLTFGEAGTYEITATHSGYQTLTQLVDLPTENLVLVMQKSETAIQEVTISKKSPLIERKIDRVSFNVENSIIASGGSAWEAVGKAPGVQITSSNTITANRKNVRIYLDGKPLQVSGDDLAVYLQGIPSDQVAKIEIFSNPPARFEAEGTSIVNIITKKAKKKGFNLSLNSGITQGHYTGYSGSMTFNYRKDKWNVYGNDGFTHRHTIQDHNSDINYGNSIWNTLNRTVNKSDTHSYRFGIDYQLSENQLLGFMIIGNNRRGDSDGRSHTQIYSSAMKLDSLLTTESYGSVKGSQYAYNLNYNLKLDSAKSSLNIDLDYSPFRNSNNSLTDSKTLLSDGTQTNNFFLIFTPSSQDISILSGKADYQAKLSDGLEISSGIKYSATKSINIFDYYYWQDAKFKAVDNNNSNFTYKEDVVSLYSSVSGKFGNLTFQGGLRGEYTRTVGHQKNQDILNRRNYFKLFPTAFLQYKLNDNHEFQLNYAYRIERPEYNRLNPAKRYSSPYNIYAGNPALQPAFVNNLEAGYTYKQNYNLTAYFSSTKDVFTNIDVQDNDTSSSYGTHANLGLSTMAGLRFSAQFKPIFWWDLILLADVYQQREKSDYLSGSYDYHMFSFYFSLNQSFMIDKKSGLKAEING